LHFSLLFSAFWAMINFEILSFLNNNENKIIFEVKIIFKQFNLFL